MFDSTVKAKCRNCGCFSPSDKFRLHYEIRQMVCPKCYSGKTKKEEEKKKEKKTQPPGWDAEDEYLEKVRNSKKQEIQNSYKKIQGTDFVQYSCVNCKFSFKYNPLRKRPRTCPYCNAEIPKIKTYSVL